MKKKPAKDWAFLWALVALVFGSIAFVQNMMVWDILDNKLEQLHNLGK